MESDRSNRSDKDFSHVPVLPGELLQHLRCESGRQYVDCTVGQGGLARMILQASQPSGRVLGLDRDEDAVAASRAALSSFGDRVQIMHGNFTDLSRHLAAAGIAAAHGVVFDLGVSSAQLGAPDRGFSFQADGPLDMRMDRRAGRTAAQLVNETSETELARMIYELGEERYARRIAAAIARVRARRPFSRTAELVDAIRSAVPSAYRHGRLHCATRTFQALRIAVNDELSGLERALRDAAEALEPGGRLCVIAFHSLEDRIVKQTFRALAQGPEPYLKLITKKPVTPGEQEQRENRRARSAKLRVAERMPVGRCA